MALDSPILQRVAAKALIVNDQGQLLILREAKTYEEGTNHGRYHLPGGRVEPGEPFFAGLHREIMEETGLKVEVERPVYVDEWFPMIRGVKNHIVAMFFACKALTGEVKLSLEHDDFRWVYPGDITQYDVMDPEPAAIKAWMSR
jgi:8-oxo-dGTP diphosphatase